jgi:hypothetical protein
MLGAAGLPDVALTETLRELSIASEAQMANRTKATRVVFDFLIYVLL